MCILEQSRAYPAEEVSVSCHSSFQSFDNENYSPEQVLNSAEVWDPKRDSWELLPPMRHARAGARGFVLPGGRFAVRAPLNASLYDATHLVI